MLEKIEVNPDLHSNPDAEVWAKEFGKYFKEPDEETMIGWFANAMMAMHDYIYQTKTVTDNKSKRSGANGSK